MPRPLLASLCVLFLISATLSYVQAQTWEEIFMEPSVFINDLHILPDGQHGWAVGSRGAGGQVMSVLLRTDDGGAHWEALPLPGAPSVTLNGVFFIDPDWGWIVGSSGRIYHTVDGGDSWAQKPVPSSRTLSKVIFIDRNRGWACGGWNDGSSYLVLESGDGGLTWTNRQFGSTAYSCEDIYFTDEDNGWICGYDNQLEPHIHHTADGGLNWTRQKVTAGLGEVSAIEFATPLIGWATTSSIYAAPAGAILHTEDGGANWDIQGHTYLDYNYALDVQDAQRVAISACQVLSPAQQRVFVTDDGGGNWTGHTLPTAVYSNGIQYQEPDIWVGSQYAQIQRSRDNGLSWDWEHYAPLWNSIDWSDAATGWLVSGSHTGNDGYVLRSDNGGLSWARDYDAPGGGQVSFVDDQHGWMVQRGNGGRVHRTTDGGESWTEHAIGAASWLEGAFFIDTVRGWVFGGNGMIRRSDDGGQTWTGQASGTGNYVQLVIFADAEEGWAAGGYGSGSGFIRHTLDGGDTWVAQSPAAPDHFTAGCFLNDQEGWLGAVNGRVHKTTNGGASWSIAGMVSHPFVDVLQMEDASNGWLVARNLMGGGPGEDGRGFIYRTVDAGATWTLQWDAPLPLGSISDLAFHPGGSIWACGNNATLLRYGDPTAVVDFDPAGAMISGISSEPNPFMHRTRIHYTLRESNRVQLVIYDVRGRRVVTVHEGYQGAGAKVLHWDGKADNGRPLPSGVYFAHLKAGEESRVQRIVRLR